MPNEIQQPPFLDLTLPPRLLIGRPPLFFRSTLPRRLGRMAHLATPSFLNHLKSLYPQKRLPNCTDLCKSSSTAWKLNRCIDLVNPWYIIAAVSFCASNEPEAVSLVFQHALKDLQADEGSREETLLLARKVRDALFKAGLICGYPRVRSDAMTPESISLQHLALGD